MDLINLALVQKAVRDAHVDHIGPSGPKGDKGDKGDPLTWDDLTEEQKSSLKGADGKSAYQYAVDGGYTGTKAEFAAKLAAEIPQADWNQNDSTAADYVKNRTHYEESTYTDYVLNSSGMDSEITGFSMPEVGETITVKINGIESVETVKEATSDLIGMSYKYIGNTDFDSLNTGGTGWIVMGVGEDVVGFANPDTTITVKTIVVHKINNKFINFDGFVRTFDYHFKRFTIYKTLYDDDGSECLLYKVENNSDIILPEVNSDLFGFMSEIGFSAVGTVGLNSCFITGFIINGTDSSIKIRHAVLGTDTTEMEKIAASNGYTLTKNPNA